MWTATKEKHEDLQFSVDRNRLRIKGSKSGVNYYRLYRQKLIHEKKPWLYATLTSTGELRWSDGYTSEIEGNLCRKIVRKQRKSSKCKI